MSNVLDPFIATIDEQTSHHRQVELETTRMLAADVADRARRYRRIAEQQQHVLDALADRLVALHPLLHAVEHLRTGMRRRAAPDELHQAAAAVVEQAERIGLVQFLEP